jgi:sugar/nucleoside kinase (ribokinase family)
VSENSDRYNLVIPCLPYVDYLIINETEAGKLTSITPIHKNLEKIAQKLKSMGVNEKVIIHMPEGSVCYSDKGFSKLGSYKLSDDYIKGTTGAGDAFCAGALIGIYENKTDLEIMEFASACAVKALGSTDATSGLVSKAEIEEFCKKIERENFEV